VVDEISRDEQERLLTLMRAHRDELLA